MQNWHINWKARYIRTAQQIQVDIVPSHITCYYFHLFVLLADFSLGVTAGKTVLESKCLGVIWAWLNRSDALPVAQPTASKYWRIVICCMVNTKTKQAAYVLHKPCRMWIAGGMCGAWGFFLFKLRRLLWWHSCVVKPQDDDRNAEVNIPTTAKELVKSINERFGKVQPDCGMNNCCGQLFDVLLTLKLLQLSMHRLFSHRSGCRHFTNRKSS